MAARRGSASAGPSTPCRRRRASPRRPTGGGCRTRNRCRRGAAAECATASRRCCAIDRVYEAGAHRLSQGMATARSQGSQCVQSSYPVCERLLDQQTLESGTVDEQVSRDLPPTVELECLDVAAFTIQAHVGDLAFDMFDAGGHRPALEIARHQRGIEVQCVVEEQKALAVIRLSAPRTSRRAPARTTTRSDR